MATGKQNKPALTQDDNSGYLSDESEFYGDEATIRELEDRAGTLDTAAWWQHKSPSLTEIANSNVSATMEDVTMEDAKPLYNPYEGSRCGRQLGETVEEFLRRLPPATTRVSATTPWIYIANPFLKAPTGKCEPNIEEGLAEGPLGEDSDWDQFVVLGRRLLEELISIRDAIEKQNAGDEKSTIARAVNIERDKIVRKILDQAIGLHCTSGKWMMFCPTSEVNTIWSVVARHTAEANFGIAAKVACDEGNGRDRLICVYTENFNDMEDVTRVIRKMKDLGLVSLREKPLYYKCDAYTYLGLNSNNEYNIRASLYNSADVLTTRKDQQKLDSYLNKKRENSGWRRSEP